MIPKANIVAIGQQVKTGRYPTLTFRVDFTGNRAVGLIDGVEAMKQAIYKIILTERYRYVIYNWDYGIELKDLFGKPRSYVYPELKRRLEDALLQDDRILNVGDFEFSAPERDVVGLIFMANTIYGQFTAEGEVRV